MAPNKKRIYLVGGAVRDLLLGRPPKDNDFVVVGFTVDEFKEKYPSAIQIGKSFPVFKVPGVGEFAFARKEKKVGIGHNAFEVEADPNVSLNDDLYRRDFTINAMALAIDYDRSKPVYDQVIDPYGGLSDLHTKTLRHVSDAFVEDPLRVYRLARFAAQLNFGIAKETLTLAKTIKEYELYSLAPERVGEETRKAMVSDRPRFFFEVLLHLHALGVWHHDLMRLVGVPAGPPGHHDELDAFEHVMLGLDYSVEIAPNLKIENIDIETVRFSILTHDLGKGITPKDEWPRHIDHETKGLWLVDRFYERLKLPGHLKQAALFVCENHLRVHTFLKMKHGKKADLLRMAEKTPLKIEGVAYACLCDALGRKAKIKDCAGASAMLSVANTFRETTGHPIPDSLVGKNIGLWIRNKKGLAIEKYLEDKCIARVASENPN